ncbi:hypothetical protein EJ04DRAFT_248339 [Polyplosphaeria fusca]|uniref:BZIP domain-containing protein n=1 Tax=Polyplosphaeria fusca TaxID=682080 RepID=A0A9P4QZX2_9PLEO|nr:hypothetical protein EJ04DRAFT_248339 [Polyplosphaeria fusca]
MDPSTSPQSQTSSRPGRKPKSVDGQKPKKVNSEVRKQQNRIASRNYREKRKRKLQYLQQLLRDGPADQASQSLDPNEDGRTRSLSAEYHPPTPFPPIAYALPSSSAVDPALSTTASYDSRLLATSQSYQPIEPSWSAQLYDGPPHVSSWNIPHWMPSIDYAPPVQSGQGDFSFSHAQPSFEGMPTPPQQREPAADNLFILGSYGHCRRWPADNQSESISSVSLRSSSPYDQAQYYSAP